MSDFIQDTSKLLKFIIDKMDPEQQRFVQEFYKYIQHEEGNAFVIDLENVFYWMGFTRQDHAKSLLKNNFELNVDFILLPRIWEQDDSLHGGHNKEITMMTTDTFKCLCMQANTDQGKKSRMYYVKMEKIVGSYHVDELKSKLADQERREKRNIEKVRHNSLIEAFGKQAVVYFIKVKELDGNQWIVKIGASDDIRNRCNALAAQFGMAVLIDVIASNQNFKFEMFLHNHPENVRIQCFDDIQPGVRSTETFYVDDTVYARILRIAKKHADDFTGFNAEQYLENKKIQFQQDELEVEKQRIEVQKQQIKLDMQKCSMATNGIIIPQLSIEDQQLEHDVKKTAMLKQQPLQTFENIDEIDADRMVSIVSRQVAKGSKIQRYDENGKLLETYQGETDAIRRFPGSTSTLIKRAIETKMLYKGFRWMFLSKDRPDDEVQEVGNNTGNVIGINFGFIAVLNLSRTMIVEVFPSQKEVAVFCKFKGTPAVSIALRKFSKSGGHYLKMWNECDEELKSVYLKYRSLPEPYSCGVHVVKMHPITREVVKVYPSYQHATIIHHFSRKTLQRAIACDEVLHEFRWKVLEKTEIPEIKNEMDKPEI
jgi:phage anti-repressor protein